MALLGEPAARAGEQAPKPATSGFGRRMDYPTAKLAVASEDCAVRLDLAKRTDLQPEMLYYLAEDEEAGVRRAVAENQSTPRQADALLVEDVDDDVRISLVRKISRLAPDLNSEAQSWLQDITLKILDDLSQDELPRVRRIIAEEIRHLDNLPHELIRRLAEDAELTVCAPILEYSPLLSGDDLLEIMALGPPMASPKAIMMTPSRGSSPTRARKSAKTPWTASSSVHLSNRTGTIRWSIATIYRIGRSSIFHGLSRHLYCRCSSSAMTWNAAPPPKSPKRSMKG